MNSTLLVVATILTLVIAYRFCISFSEARTFSLKDKIAIVFLFFVLISISQVQSATLITLSAKQATGGALMKTNLNDSAVYFPTANPANDRIVWTVPGTLPAGLYQVDIDFYQASGVPYSINEYISFEASGATQLGLLDFYYLGLSTGTYTKSIGFYSPNVLSSIALIKSSQRNSPTFGIRTIRITAGTEAAISSKQFVFQLPVTGTQIAVPFSLPKGLYVVNAAVATATTWVGTGGSTTTTPSATTNRIYLEENAQPAILSGGPVTSITVNHFPPATGPNMSSAGGAPLLTIVDTTYIETRTLKLIGYAGTGLPQLDILPGGKKVALVSSWDDGGLDDIQLMDTLYQYGIKGTFMMVAGTSAMIPRMNELEAKAMEIGSHSWSHPPFYNSSPQRCLDESVEARRLLESKLGHPIISFAYPYDYSPAYDTKGDYVLRSLRSAGYWFGRSTSTGATLRTVDAMSEPLTMKPTTHFIGSAANMKSLLDARLLIPGSVFHLWGHSYELAGTGMATLRSTLAVLAKNPSVWYATIGELMLWKYTREKLQIVANLNVVGDKTFTLKMPWLHPYLRKVPVSLIVPAGVTVVEWRGIQYPVTNSRVQLMWDSPALTNVGDVIAPNKFQLSTKKNQLDVKNITSDQEVVVCTLSGKMVANKLVHASSNVTFNLASGVYLVRVGTETSKVLIN